MSFLKFRLDCRSARSLRLAGMGAFACILFHLFGTAPLQAQATTGNTTPPVQVTSLKQNRSGDNTMQIERGMVVTQVVNAPPRQLIEAAYGVQEDRISGGPAWAAADHYDITYSGGALSSEGTGAALRQVLAERFHLALRQQNRNIPIYALVVGKGGAKLTESALPENETGQQEAISRLNVTETGGEITLTGHIGALADALNSELDRPVLDRTGLTGIYAIRLRWNAATDAAKAIASALQQQLGLDLAPQQAELPHCVIQSIDRPAEM